jgi:DNA-binding response OmpR family regulator
MNQTIVVVDDDLEILEFLQLLLGSRGVDVVVCHAFADAAELIRRVLPSLVLLDLQEPSNPHAGLQVLDQLRAQEVTAAIPVFLMSSDHAALKAHATILGQFRARPLAKPFDLQLLSDEVDRAAA